MRCPVPWSPRGLLVYSVMYLWWGVVALLVALRIVAFCFLARLFLPTLLLRLVLVSRWSWCMLAFVSSVSAGVWLMVREYGLWFAPARGAVITVVGARVFLVGVVFCSG